MYLSFSLLVLQLPIFSKFTFANKNPNYENERGNKSQPEPTKKKIFDTFLIVSTYV
jgi:hypothetical protein